MLPGQLKHVLHMAKHLVGRGLVGRFRQEVLEVVETHNTAATAYFAKLPIGQIARMVAYCPRVRMGGSERTGRACAQVGKPLLVQVRNIHCNATRLQLGHHTPTERRQAARRIVAAAESVRTVPRERNHGRARLLKSIQPSKRRAVVLQKRRPFHREHRRRLPLRPNRFYPG